jgi:hypothetical protein
MKSQRSFTNNFSSKRKKKPDSNESGSN